MVDGPTPVRHRRGSAPSRRAATLIGTGIAALLFWGFTAFVDGYQPTEPDTPFLGQPPSASSEGTLAPSPPAGPPSSTGAGGAPGGPGPLASPRPAPAASTFWPAAARPAVSPSAAPRPALQAAPEPAPQPAAQPSAPRPALPEPAPQPSGEEPTPRPSSQEPPSRPSPDDRPSASPTRPEGPGKPTRPPKANGPKIDARYVSCEEVIANGLGPYKQWRDEEYAWYPDPDGDGWACERPRWGPGRR